MKFNKKLLIEPILKIYIKLFIYFIKNFKSLENNCKSLHHKLFEKDLKFITKYFYSNNFRC
jgi:hypothetical protein